jgi:hypothetical protein
MEKHLQFASDLTFEAKPRLVWTAPRLTLLGDVAGMTETGSMVAMEDFFQNDMCFLANMTGNMC